MACAIVSSVSSGLHVASVTSQIVDLLARHGVLAVLVLMAVDALLPAGGEVTMLYAGVIASGAVSGAEVTVLGLHPSAGLAAWLTIVATGTLGYLAGSLAGWALGARGGHALLERHGRWLHLPPHRVARAQRWFDRFGPAAVFLGRLTPLVRSFISVPAGVFHTPLPQYTALTALASLIWCVLFAGLGWAVSDNWERIHDGFRYADYAVLAAVAIALVAVLARARRRVRDTPARAGAER